MRSTTAPDDERGRDDAEGPLEGEEDELGDRRAVARREADVAHERVAEPAEDLGVAVEGQRVADERPRDRRDGERRDAHHERVQRVLRPHEARVEQAQADRHEQDERGRDEHPCGVAGVDLAGGGKQRAHFATGVTARSSVSRVRMRTTRSSGTTKILPSPTSPVWAPSHSASSVGSTNSSETAISKRTLSDEAHLHARAAVRLDAVELAAVALHAAERYPAHLGAVERLEDVVDLVRPDDADDELHARAAGRSVAARRRRLVMRDPPIDGVPCRLAGAGARGLCPRGQRSPGAYGPDVQRSGGGVGPDVEAAGLTAATARA